MNIKLTDGRVNRSRITDPGRVVKGYVMKQTYERLRKRSYRMIGKPWEGEHGLYSFWSTPDHEAYVKGVKDALKEVVK